MRNKRMVGTYTSEDFVAGGTSVKRRCVFCGDFKDLLTDFAKNGTDADGNPRYRQDCKVCYNVRRNANKHKKAHSDFIGNQKRRSEQEPNFSHQEWKECMIYFGGECAYCGATTQRNKLLTKDHLRPVSDGGATDATNIIPVCRSCNSSKQDSEWREWYMKQPFFNQERMNKIFTWRNIQTAVKKQL